jgi:hypothetical protein
MRERLVCLLCVAAAMAIGAPAARGAADADAPAYGQVAAIGGFDTSATYATGCVAHPTTVCTTVLSAQSAGKFVDPVAMAVTPDATVPGGEAIYVLDLLNPQEYDVPYNGGSDKTMMLQYRIQELAINPDGSEDVVNSTTFNLQSSAAAPDEQAVALAANAAEGRVDVLIDDEPIGRFQVSQQIDEWTGSLTGMTVAVSSATLGSDLDGVSLAFAGTGATPELTVGATEYVGGSHSAVTPVIESFTAAGAQDMSWNNAAAAVNATARAWAEGSANHYAMYSMSANPDGTLNIAFGPKEALLSASGENLADFEPIMATVDLASGATTPVLPSADTDVDPGQGPLNFEIAATDLLEQDPADGNADSSSYPAPSAGSISGQALAPSVVQLSGGAGFPDGLYAGFVADDELSYDANQTPQGQMVTPPAWSMFPTTGTPNFGVRIFGADGLPVGMIGNTSPTGSCTLRGGIEAFKSFEFPGSMMALQAGPDGSLYALVQPDLDDSLQQNYPIDPARPTNPAGDEVIEFAPETSDPTAASCPQPSGNLAVTNETVNGSAPDTGAGPITVPAGTTLGFDAGDINLLGAVPWTYSWDLDNGATAGLSSSTFTLNPNNGDYERGTPTSSFTYRTPGTYTATLNLLNDFGTYTATRQIIVTGVGSVTASFTGPATAITGQNVTFDASGSTLGNGDSVLDYHWDFGDGTSDDTSSPIENWVFATAGEHTVTLTETDRVGATSTATMQVNVLQGPAPPITTLPPPTTTSTTQTTPPDTGGSGGSTGRATKKSGAVATPRIRSVKKSRQLAVTIACPASKATCTGQISVQTADPVADSTTLHAKKKVYTLGTASYSVKAGASQAVSVTLAKETQQLLNVNPLLKLKVDVSGTTPAKLNFSLLAPPQKNSGSWFDKSGSSSKTGGTSTQKKHKKL